MDPLSKISAIDRWKSGVLDEIFRALISAPDLTPLLVYKGARVLRRRLQEPLRASFDIDASLSSFATAAGSRLDESMLEHIRTKVHRAIDDFFESQNPVRFGILQSSLVNRRKKGWHPRGWDVYWLEISIQDFAEPALAASAGQLRIDIAAPEIWSKASISPLDVDGLFASALTLERIAGEKLRAFLSSLPAYRKKIRERARIARRVKDLYDLVRISRKRPLEDTAFWMTAGAEFTLACQSRSVDCLGKASFWEDWDETKMVYSADKTLPNDVTMKDVEAVLQRIITFLEKNGFIPLTTELP